MESARRPDAPGVHAFPARGLIGLRTRLLNATQGTAIMHHNFYDYQPVQGRHPGRVNGVHGLDRDGQGDRATPSTTCRIAASCSSRPTDAVYEGQIVGEHCRDNDLPVNITREKKLTNMRASTAEIKTIIKAPRDLTLEHGARIHRGRRVGRDHAEIDPAAQGAAEGERAEEA